MEDKIDKGVNKRHNLAKEGENQAVRKTYVKPQRQNKCGMFPCLRAAETSLECGHAGERGEMRLSKFNGRK